MKAVIASFLFVFVLVGGAGFAFAEMTTTTDEKAGIASAKYVKEQSNSVPIGRPAESAPEGRVLLWVQ